MIEDVFAALLRGLLPSRRARKRVIDRNTFLKERRSAEMAVRVSSGPLDGIGDRFVSGCWRVAPGVISLGSTDVHVGSVDPSHRVPSLREDFHVFPSLQVYSALSGDAIRDIAIQESEVGWVLEVVRASS